MRYKLYFTDESACAWSAEFHAQNGGFDDAFWDIKGDLSNIEVTDEVINDYMGEVICYKDVTIKPGFAEQSTLYHRPIHYWHYMVFCMEDGTIVKIDASTIGVIDQLKQLVKPKEQLLLLQDEEELAI